MKNDRKGDNGARKKVSENDNFFLQFELDFLNGEFVSSYPKNRSLCAEISAMRKCLPEKF